MQQNENPHPLLYFAHLNWRGLRMDCFFKLGHRQFYWSIYELGDKQRAHKKSEKNAGCLWLQPASFRFKNETSPL
jgi:hypothetical protein